MIVSVCLTISGCWCEQRSGVHGSLRDRSAAAMRKPRQRVPGAALEAHRIVSEGDADRAEQPEIVQVQDRARALCAGGGERAPAEQWMQVVRVHHIGAHPAHDLGHRVLVDAAAQQRVRRLSTRGSRARALQQLHRVAVARQQRGDVTDGSLLAALGSVTVMDYQDTHLSGRFWQRVHLCKRAPSMEGLERHRYGGSPNPAEMPIALLTTYLAGYRTPLYERLGARHGSRCSATAAAERYVPPWIAHRTRRQISSPPVSRPPPARAAPRARSQLATRYEAVIAPYAGGAILPAAYAGATAHRQRVRAVGVGVGAAALGQRTARAARHAAHLPPRRRGRRLWRARSPVRRRYPRARRGRVRRAPVGRAGTVRRRDPARRDRGLPRAPLAARRRPIVLYAGRLVPEKGVDVLLAAWGGEDRLRRWC